MLFTKTSLKCGNVVLFMFFLFPHSLVLVGGLWFVFWFGGGFFYGWNVFHCEWLSLVKGQSQP